MIRTKRDGGVLSDAAIDWVIDAYTHGRVADEQMSALLMAIFLRGMTRAEIARWTAAMIDSGERIDFTDLRRDGKPLALVDKHSTGGVGDKITIPLVPVVMACGGAVPQAAGRGLGHTGGTLDKLESIPGFTAELSKARIRQQLCDLGAAIFAAGELAPADRKIYALRDVTGTTESLPLIASSVMSKKIAEGAQSSGARHQGRLGGVPQDRGGVARAGPHHGRRSARRRSGHPRAADRHVDAAGPDRRQRRRGRRVAGGAGRRRPGRRRGADAGAGRARCSTPRASTASTRRRRLRDGTAMDRFRALVAAQGGDPVRSRYRSVRTPRPSPRRAVARWASIDAMAVGLAVWRLGAGRSRPGEQVQSGAGLRIHRRPGESVCRGRAAVHAVHRDAGAVRGRDGRTRRRLVASGTRRRPSAR